MNQGQISPNGQHDGGGSLLVAILNRVGILVIIVAGVFIAPTGLPEFPSQGRASTHEARKPPRSSLGPAPSGSPGRTLRRPARTGRSWKPLVPVIDDAIEIDTPDGIAPALPDHRVRRRDDHPGLCLPPGLPSPRQRSSKVGGRIRRRSRVRPRRRSADPRQLIPSAPEPPRSRESRTARRWWARTGSAPRDRASGRS